ncbi:NUDIX hydrolase [Fictibacillus sp. Mic-4]|uniref:NUDIX domain-containing protein n=1 Tax=Fictibacillus sp. Mic-4 TaxID=3132826 RepID=UPI003CF3AB2E
MTKNEEALKHYDSSKYVTPDGYTSDIAVFTIVTEPVKEEGKAPPKRTLKLMLIQRSELNSEGEPNIEGGKWALPGGFVQPNETAYEAAIRELSEETGIDQIHLKHYGVYDKPGRDPRGWIITNAHYAIVTEDFLGKRKAADDANDVNLFTLEEVFQLELAFDHREVIHDAIEMIKKDMVQTTIAKGFLPEEFTLSELRDVLLTVSDEPYIKEKSIFFRKTPTLPFIELAVDREGNPKTTRRNSYRPSKLYRFTDSEPIASIYT